MMNVYTPAEAHIVPPSGQDPAAFSWLPYLLGFLRRRWLTIAAGIVAVLGLAVVYMLIATPQFTATTAMLVDIRQSNPFRQEPVIADSAYENTFVESHVEVMRSEGLARTVVQQTDLLHDAAFNRIGPGIMATVVGTVMGIFGDSDGGGGSSYEERRQATAVEQLMRLVTVRRIAQTAMVEVSVRSPDRLLSARLANALTDAYLQNQVASFSEVSVQASGWMQKRVAELRAEAIAADRAVQEYKASHNILNTDKGQFSEQQLGEMSMQMTTARARLADAQAKFDRVKSISADRLADESLTEALENTVIVSLRKQYLDARRRESEWSTRYGTAHAAAVNARAEMAELQRSIQNELNRISQTYRSELEIAKANEAQVAQQFTALAGASAESNADRIMLRALQSSADSYKLIFENFLQRYTQAVQDQSFPIPSARIITRALPPQKKSQPKALIVLGVGLVLGVTVGLGIAIVRELLDQGLRTPAQIKATTGYDCLGLLPRLSGRSIGGFGGGEAEPSVRQLATRPSALRYVVDQPNSAYAEGMRGVALRTTWHRRTPGCQVIGCFALRQGDGASTVAANLAQSLSDAGYNTLLVDLDLRRADLTRALAPINAGGVAEVAEGGIPLDQAVWRDPETGLRFLPAAAGKSAARPARVLAPARLERLLAVLRADYDRVVIDLPAFGGTADAGVIAELLDGLVLVSNWGGMDGATLSEMLEGLHDDRDKLFGVVLNRADLGQLGQYGAAGHVPLTQAAGAI